MAVTKVSKYVKGGGSHPELKDILNRIVDLYTDLGSRMIAAELIAAKLMSEITKRSGDPSLSMIRLTAEVTGLAHLLASTTKTLANEYYDPSAVTHQLDKLRDMAERLEGHGR